MGSHPHLDHLQHIAVPCKGSKNVWNLSCHHTSSPFKSLALARIHPEYPQKMGLSINGGIPKWMVYNRKYLSNGWFGGSPIHLETSKSSARTGPTPTSECWVGPPHITGGVTDGGSKKASHESWKSLEIESRFGLGRGTWTFHILVIKH